MVNEKIKKIRNFLFSDENIIFVFCHGDFMENTGYKNSILYLSIYYNRELSFKEIIDLHALLSSKFYENLNLNIISNETGLFNPVLLHEILLNGYILFIKNQKIYDQWIIKAYNYFFDTIQIREKIYAQFRSDNR